MNRKNHRNGIPPFIDPAFAHALGHSDRSPHRKQEHKTRQLCRQAQHALCLALGECADEVLQRIYIVDVTTLAHDPRLLVHVMVPQDMPLAEALAHLNAAAVRLRAAVAEAITRKRAPELTFIPAAPEEVRP